jgi:hypothetical protein
MIFCDYGITRDMFAEKRDETTSGFDWSIVSYCRVSFQDFFRLPVQIAGHLMNLVLLAAAGASHTYFPAHPMHFQLCGTFFTLHDLFNRAFVRG